MECEESMHDKGWHKMPVAVAHALTLVVPENFLDVPQNNFDGSETSISGDIDRIITK